MNCSALASYQIRKIAGCACASNAGNVFHATDFNGIVSYPGMHRNMCVMPVMHVGIANTRLGETSLALPNHAQPAWQKQKQLLHDWCWFMGKGLLAWISFLKCVYKIWFAKSISENKITTDSPSTWHIRMCILIQGGCQRRCSFVLLCGVE